jgi:hypothetical protein
MEERVELLQAPEPVEEKTENQEEPEDTAFQPKE